MSTNSHIFSSRLQAIKEARERLGNIAAAAVTAGAGTGQKTAAGTPPASGSVQAFVEDFAAQTLAQINATAVRLQAMHAVAQAAATPAPKASSAADDVIDVVARTVADPNDSSP